jgi:hypothetical protein
MVTVVFLINRAIVPLPALAKLGSQFSIPVVYLALIRSEYGRPGICAELLEPLDKRKLEFDGRNGADFLPFHYFLVTDASLDYFSYHLLQSLNGYRLGEVAGLVDIASATNRDVIGE